MKVLLTRIVILFFLWAAAASAYAQKEGTTTIILVRHAEKDAGNNPDLIPPGRARAYKLATLFPNAKPDEMYSTPYLRTKATLAPWAQAAGLQVKEYDAARQPEFAAQLRQLKGKTIVVAGHSNTIPSLVNLLLGQDKYPSWDETVYNKLFVVTIKKGKAKATVIEY